MRVARAAAAALVLVASALCPAVAVDQVQTAQLSQLGTQTLTIPNGQNAAVTVHMVQDQGRPVNNPPKPPMESVPLFGAQLQTFPATAMAQCGSDNCGQGGQFAAAPIVTPAAPLNLNGVDAITGFQTQGGQPLLSMGIQTQPGAKIVGVDVDTPCGCPQLPTAAQCNNPCKPVRTIADEIESRLTDVKNEIVNRAQQLQADSVWVRQVRAVIKHYTRKIEEVQRSTGTLKSEIKRLFQKKKRYEDLLLKQAMDKGHFTRVLQQQALGSQGLGV